MKEIKLKLHSIVDLITNSSTVLYTDSRKSEEALINVMGEIFKLHNIDKKVKDVFDISVTVEDLDEHIYSYIYDNPDEFELEYDDDLGSKVNDLTIQYMEDFKSGKIKMPDWMDGLGEDSASNWISIVSKEKEYEYLAGLLEKLIYSIDVEEGIE